MHLSLFVYISYNFQEVIIFDKRDYWSTLLKQIMTSSREILTFQFGNYANYVGSHWWNIQEFGFNYDETTSPSEINHDVLYREGVDFKGQTTYTPRLLLIDLQGSLNYLPEEGILEGYVSDSLLNPKENSIEKIKEKIPWEKSNVEVIQKERVKKPEFQVDIDDPDIDMNSKQYNLKENVKTWADFLYTRYHPRSFNIIKNYKLSAEKETFDSFSNGQRTWETEAFDLEFVDKIRQYIEECNNCQGFQLIFDCTNGFSGLSLSCLQHLNDEYGKSSFAIPIFLPRNILYENADEALTNSIRTANIALCYSKLVEHSSMFVPLSTYDRVWRSFGIQREFPLIKYDGTNLYHTSAILASYLDTLTLRYRLKDNFSNSLTGLCRDSTYYGRKMNAAGFSFPFPMYYDQDLIECLDKFEGKMFTQLSPNTNIGTDYVVQSVSVRGIPRNRLKKPFKFAQNQMKMSAYKCESISEMFQLYFQCENHASMAHVTAVQNPIDIKIPYPLEIFDLRLNLDGFLKDVSRSQEEKISSIPAVATVQCSGDLADTIESLYREASRVKISKIHRFKETGLESDEYLEALEFLLQFKDNYEDNFEL